MRNLISLLIIGLSVNILIAQDRVEISEINIKTTKVVWYKTYLHNHYRKEHSYYLRGEKYSGIIFENWENGDLKQEFEVKNGRPDGFRKSYYANGNIEDDFPGENKMEEAGKYNVRYHQNGSISYVITVLPIGKDGHRYKTSTFYYSNGQIQFISPTKDNLEHGIQYYYYDNGIIQSELPKKDGMPHGIEYFYDNTGVLESEISYKDGERHGLEKDYTRYGGTKITDWKYGRNLTKERAR